VHHPSIPNRPIHRTPSGTQPSSAPGVKAIFLHPARHGASFEQSMRRQAPLISVMPMTAEKVQIINFLVS